MSTTGTYALPPEVFDWLHDAAELLAGVTHAGYADKEKAQHLLERLSEMSYVTQRTPPSS